MIVRAVVIVPISIVFVLVVSQPVKCHEILGSSLCKVTKFAPASRRTAFISSSSSSWDRTNSRKDLQRRRTQKLEQKQLLPTRSTPCIQPTLQLLSSSSDDTSSSNGEVQNETNKVESEQEVTLNGESEAINDIQQQEENATVVTPVSDASSSTTTTATESNTSSSTKLKKRLRIRNRVSRLAKKLNKPIDYVKPMPQAIVSVIKDATLNAVDIAVDEVMARRAERLQQLEQRALLEEQSIEDDEDDDDDDDDDDEDDEDITPEAIIDKAFEPMEQSLLEMEESLQTAREAFGQAKNQAREALEIVQAAALAQAEGISVALAEKEQLLEDSNNVFTGEEIDLTSLTYEDVNYQDSEMAPPFLDGNSCLIPGEPLVRVEKAPDNSRRIFAGIDIFSSVDDVWNLLTDYHKLQDVIPNLVVNEVMEEYTAAPLEEVSVDASQPDEVQCEELSKQLKGALLRQVGGAKVAGINFSARTKLEVREWPNGMPDFAHFTDDLWEGQSRDARAKANTKIRLQRYRFPRPFVLSELPTKDISMQSIVDDDGEFRLYQGVWRMQPLVGCAPSGQEAMRLSYAVEISPRPYLPVYLVEGRIVRDLCTNLQAISEYVTNNK